MAESKELSPLMGSLDVDGIEIPCHATISNLQLIFTPAAKDLGYPDQIPILLVGVLESKVIPHSSVLNADSKVDIEAPEMPAVFIISYLTDLFDKTSHKTVLFTGMRGPILAIQKRMDEIVASMKQSLKFHGPELSPTLESLRYSGVRVAAKKRHFGNAFNLIGGVSSILDMPEIEALRIAFPLRFQLYPWEKIYSSSTDGTVLDTMYKAAGKKNPIVLLILDDNHTKLGAFISEGFKTDVRGFYGSGETFVFNFNPLISVYRWSQRNTFFVSTTSGDLIIGSSDHPNGSAIYIDDLMKSGYSNDCQTFESPSLTQKPMFHVISVEAWHVALPPTEQNAQ